MVHQFNSLQDKILEAPVKPFVELVIPLEGHAFVGELGFVKAPSGGNEDVAVTFGPMWFLRGGILF